MNWGPCKGRSVGFLLRGQDLDIDIGIDMEVDVDVDVIRYIRILIGSKYPKLEGIYSKPDYGW